MTNPFEAYSDEVKPIWLQNREASAAKSAATRASNRLDESDELLKRYRKGKREEKEALLSGPHGKEVKGLISFLRSMTPSSAPALVKLIQNAVWLKDASPDVRFQVLDLVSRAIEKIRIQDGRPPFDDEMPDEPPSAFILIREELRP